MIVQKAVKMARMMNVPILGLVENMSWFMCPDCGKKHSIFGDSHIEEVAKEYDTQVLAKLPIDPELAKCVDEGKIEFFEGNYLDEAAEIIEKKLSK
ncbi:MAG: P-loop NTPase, partial [Ruminococcus bromii]